VSDSAPKAVLFLSELGAILPLRPFGRVGRRFYSSGRSVTSRDSRRECPDIRDVSCKNP